MTQDNQTKNHKIVSIYRQTKDNMRVTAEVQGLDWGNERINMSSGRHTLNDLVELDTRWYQISRFYNLHGKGCPIRHSLDFSPDIAI